MCVLAGAFIRNQITLFWVQCSLDLYMLFDRNTSPELKRACQWLVEHRLPDGGWGENFESCEQKVYVPADKSQIVNTAWALLGLLAVR